jgi:sodium/bile acid cotransporter 7
MISVFKKNWFMLLLVATTILTVSDTTGIITKPGQWLKYHHAPEAIIAIVFFLSGLALNLRQIRTGISDVKATVIALIITFLAAPLLALLFGNLPIQAGLIVGLYLVAAVPPTLSSGVVMTGAAGGNMAHALITTILANCLAVVTVPFTLGILLKYTGNQLGVELDIAPVIAQVATLILLPLLAGLFTGNRSWRVIQKIKPYSSILSQSGIVAIVWMGVSKGRETIVSDLDALFPVVLMVFCFHLFLVVAAVIMAHLFRLGPGRKESVIFIGGQKTLALSVILQVSLFPEYGLALVVCIMHHLIHLIMDSFLVQFFKSNQDQQVK